MASNYQELLNWKRGGGRGGGGRREGEGGERTEESCLRFKRGGGIPPMIFNLGWSFDTFSPVTFDMDWSRKFILPASII